MASTSGYEYPSGESDGSLRGFVRVIRRRLVLIAGITLSVVLIGAPSIYLSPDTYRSTAFVESDFTRFVTETGGVQNTADDEQTIIHTQIETIATRLVPRVVDLQNLMADPEFNGTLPRPPAHTAAARWVDSHWADFKSYLKKLIPVIRAPPPSSETVRTHVIDSVRQRLDAINDGRSHVIKVTFSSQYPEKAANLANAFAQEFIVDQIETKHKAEDETAQQLSSRLTDLRENLKASELAAQAFREKRTETLPIGPNNLTAAADQLAQMNQQLVLVQGERAQAEARLSRLQDLGRAGSAPDSANEVLNSLTIQHLKDRETEVRQRIAQLGKTYGPAYPEMQRAQSELQSVLNAIATETRNIGKNALNEVHIAREKETALNTRIKTLEGVLATNTKTDLRYQELQREAENNRKVYDTFTTRLKDLDVQQGLARPTARIIHEAEVPVQPAPPGKTVRIGIVALVGALVALLIGYLRDRLDLGARRGSEIEQVAGQQALAFIPTVPRHWVGRRRGAVSDPRGIYADALQAVRARIQQTMPRIPPCLITVSSAVPEEGKTTFCVSLVRLLAQSGRRVLLIDGDLRRPSIGKILGDDRRGTIVDVLTGRKSLEEVVQTHDSGVDFIVNDGSVADAQRVFSGIAMREIKQLFRGYEFVIFDTPPVAALPDAGVIAQNSDGAIFLVRWGKTPREVAASALRRLLDFNVNVLGVVFTRVDIRALPKYEGTAIGYYYQHYRRYYADRSAS
jgi:polysaccharide biosynthesis transport protein